MDFVRRSLAGLPSGLPGVRCAPHPPLPPSRGLPSPIDKHLHQRVLRERGRSAAPTRPRAAPGPTQRPPRR
ncbi:unnamed protein product [Pieris brassicae]|uniref:Uncharacterized protein n=1 Tax=Pieris brassicae TaxID=7116 RepID=A0A9P0TLV7_PIEBR|nr:unnamed protein product [Pieris brassicae]